MASKLIGRKAYTRDDESGFGGGHWGIIRDIENNEGHLTFWMEMDGDKTEIMPFSRNQLKIPTRNR